MMRAKAHYAILIGFNLLDLLDLLDLLEPSLAALGHLVIKSEALLRTAVLLTEKTTH
jgi:hypothetical protein